MPRGVLTPEQIERKLAALGSPETRAKMRAAKLGRPQDPEHVRNAAEARRARPLSETHRAHLSAAQRGRPKSAAHVEALRASHTGPAFVAKMRAAASVRTPARVAALDKVNEERRGRPLSQAHREAISRGLVEAYLSGRRAYSALEVRAAELLLPHGCTRFPWLDGHAFDFLSADGTTVYEINSCRLHDHRLEDPTCRFTPMLKADNGTYRRIAKAHGLRLVELWECRESDWLNLI